MEDPQRDAETRNGPAPRPLWRIGLGHDTHRLGSGGPLILGGVRIECDRHAIGHSDADALLHAVIDALLGALAQGDIGDRYPDTDPANQGRDSRTMLREVATEVRTAGWQLVNLDCNIFAEQPKLGSRKQEICRSLATLLEIDESQVSVKAKTGEGVDAVGHGMAISTSCVVLLMHSDPTPVD